MSLKITYNFDKMKFLFVFFSINVNNYNPQIEMFGHFKTKSSFHKTKRII